MTEKSEDQVIWWLCDQCEHQCNKEEQVKYHITCGKNSMSPYIPHSQYLALKSDLAVAVEALKEIFGDGGFTNYAAGDIFRDVAKEALNQLEET